jgi:dual specificity tyrosine-phosphorylation-regulated kinase 2/3/4
VIESETTVSRSASATSSLDPYYFGLQSPTDSPAPPFLSATHFNATPELHPISYPVTPAKDPATIDRRGLVGVGELSTPRWAKVEKFNGQDSRDDGDDYELVLAEDTVKDGPDSPWTIEAIDGEWGDEDEVCRISLPNITSQNSSGIPYQPTEFKPTLRSLRSRPSVTEESGGEEILYPRKSAATERSRHLNPSDGEEEYEPTFAVVEIPAVESSTRSPPSSFDTPPRKARKRTSDEFEFDHTRTLVSRRLGSSGSLKDKARDERAVGKHRSLASGSLPGVSREKNRRESTITGNNTKATPCAGKLSDRHSRQASGSSSSSNHGDSSHSRRVHAADFSHLPPSPSSSSIQHFLKQTGGANSANTPPLQSSSKEPQALPSPNVAHSLLRGTQEGWSCLDDEATAEALRKLDGLTGKTARARASVGSFGRPASLSRSGTPPGKNNSQWEGLSPVEGICNSDDQRTPSIVEKTPKRSSNPRSSFTPKRISASSTYAGTPTTTTSPRDSTPLSATTSLISMSATTRHSMAKAKRNSAGSDVSSVHSGDATSLKDRVASLALAGDALEDEPVPPVPPLPKDLSTYRSPPTSSASHVFPSLSTTEDKFGSRESDEDLAVPSDGPPLMRPPSNLMSPSSHGYPQKEHHNPALMGSQPEPTPTITKTPSRKWSFSALNLKLSSSPSSSSKTSALPLSPRTVSFGPHLRKSASKDRARSPSSGAPKNTWPAVQQDAMSSVASLASVSSNGSAHTSKSPVLAPSLTNLKTPERGPRSRSGTDSSASTSHTTSAPTRQLAPISPTPSVRRGHSSKRLTPSSIPFFRRSSSQSIQLPPSTMAASSSPTLTSGPTQQPKNDNPLPVTGSARKKSSVLSLGLPSLLKGSSSRRSLHAEKSDPTKDVRDNQKAEGAERDNEKLDRERSKKEDKDRSESRISVLIGRKRGKVRQQYTSIHIVASSILQTLSSTDPKKLKPQNLPPMQISALPSATAQRVASLKAASSMSTPTVVPSTTRSTSSSRVTSQTVSSMQKQSDSSLRGRNQLPTIAGSPSVGANSSQSVKDAAKDHTPSLLNSMSKETPTKIPRISSRTSAISTPPPKNSSVLLGARASVNAAGQSVPSIEPSPTPSGLPINEFGVMENGDSHISRVALHSTSQRQSSVQVSPSAGPRVPRQVTATTSSTSGSFLQRKGNRDSASFTGLRKASTSSVTSTVSVPPSESHRFSALSPSKGLKLLSPRVNISSGRVASSSTSQNTYQAIASPASSRQSLSSPSPVPSGIDEEELLGDEEMMHYIRRQQAKKMASGATQAELDDLLRFPEPLGPGSPSSPAGQCLFLLECQALM